MGTVLRLPAALNTYNGEKIAIQTEYLASGSQSYSFYEILCIDTFGINKDPGS